jgi:hypothetical protein
VLCAYCVRLAELSASHCKRLWKAVCLDLLREGGSSELRRSPVLCGVGFLRLCACNLLKKLIKKRRVGGRSPRVGVNHVHVVFLCFVQCVDVLIC